MDLSKIMPSPEWMGPELRNHKRIDVQVPIIIRPVVGTDTPVESELKGTLRDLSTGGMMIQLNHRLKQNSKVRAHFDLSAITDEIKLPTVEFKLLGYVRQEFTSIDGDQFYGIEFAEFRTGNAASIERLIDQVS